jgi:hypothetical protein
MAANLRTALLALPFLCFFFQEFLHAIIFDKSQVLQHAQVVFSPVTFIQAFEPLARKIRTLVTVGIFSLPYCRTGCLHKEAVFTAGTAPGTISPVDSMFFQFIFFGEICHAYAAIHAAWGYYGLFHFPPFRYPLSPKAVIFCRVLRRIAIDGSGMEIPIIAPFNRTPVLIK